MRLSFSSISTYENCPLSYKFAYVDKKPAKKKPVLSFGNSIHAALANFYSVEVPRPPTLDKLLRHLEENWKKDGYKDKEEEKLYLDHAKQVLTNFYHASVDDFKIPVAIEEKFRIDLDDYTLTGIIDRMDKLPSGGYEVIDYKTSRRLPPQSKIDTDLQLSIYHLAVQEVWQINPEKLTLYFLIPNQKMSTTRTDEDIRKIKDLIKSVVDNVSQEKFEPRENPLCPWCDFQEYCPIYRHKFMREEEEKDETTTVAIEKAVDEFIELRNKSKGIKERLEELSEVIHNYCDEHKLSRLYSNKGIISRSQRVTPLYDIKKLKEILEPLGLWDKVLKVDEKSLKELTQSENLPYEIKSAIETAKEVENISYALYVKSLQDEP